MKDSGQRDQYNGGAVRDKREGKGRYDLMSVLALFRIARVYEDGAIGKGDRNWEQGIALSRFMDSALRHLNQFLAGMRDEDHLAQAAWNIMGLIHTEDQIKRGNLPAELNDLPETVTDKFKNWDELDSQPQTKRKPAIYVAGSVRGKKGDNATRAEMLENIEAGRARAKFLQESLAGCKFYFPHTHEDLFQNAFDEKYITSDQILDQCLDIVALCDFIVVTTDPEESQGTSKEVAHALINGLAVINVWMHPEHEWPAIIARAINV